MCHIHEFHACLREFQVYALSLIFMFDACVLVGGAPRGQESSASVVDHQNQVRNMSI